MTSPTEPERGYLLNGRPISPSGDGGPAGPKPGGGGTPAAPDARMLGILSMSVLAVPVILVVPLLFLQDPHPELALVPVAVGLVAGVLASVALPLWGYRMAPLEPGETGIEAQDRAMNRFRASFFVREALATVPALVSFAMTVASAPIAVVNYLPGAALSVALLAWHLKPNRWNVGRAQSVLDSRGGQSDLLARFGL